MHSKGQTRGIKWKPARGFQTHDCHVIATTFWLCCVIRLVTTNSDLKTRPTIISKRILNKFLLPTALKPAIQGRKGNLVNSSHILRLEMEYRLGD